MHLRVGRIPFLVCAPFFHDFLDKEADFSDVEFIDGPPSAHCNGLKNGSIHLSPASSITFAQKPGAFVLSPDLCTSCKFEVRSVKLFSNFPIEELNGKNIYLTPQSRASVALLRILLEIRYGLKPNYQNVFPPNAPVDAQLLIGDQALEENQKMRFPYSYDLGSLWQNWQGLPFVFGAWVISKDALSPQLRPVLLHYLDSTKQSIENFKANPSIALDHWLSKYPVKLPRKVVKEYYTSLDYQFTDERKKSLIQFFSFAKRLGLIESNPELEFL